VPSADAIQSVLAKLQSKPVIHAGDAATHSTTQLKQDLLDQLRQFAPSGQKPQLKSEDADTIDLVGMLFDQIAQEAPAKGNTQSMLTQLRVPLMRVALSDKGFFAQRSHPARELLNAVTEAGIHWIDDAESEPDPALLHKLHTVVERLNNEFDGDLSLIEHMLGDLSQHMHKLARSAAVAERRLVDASKGREKLALARETASNAIAARIVDQLIGLQVERFGPVDLRARPEHAAGLGEGLWRRDVDLPARILSECGAGQHGGTQRQEDESRRERGDERMQCSPAVVTTPGSRRSAARTVRYRRSTHHSAILLV